MRWRLLGAVVGIAAALATGAAGRADTQEPANWKALSDEADAARARGDLAGAARKLEAARAVAEGFGPQDQRRLGTLLQLGATYNQLGRYAKAEPVLRSAVQGLESLVGSDDAMLPGALAPWAVSLMHLSRPKEAVDLLKRAHAILERDGRAESLDGIAILAVLSDAEGRAGSYSDALNHVETAIRLTEKALGRRNPELVSLLERQATLLRRMGRPDEASSATARAELLKALASLKPAREDGGPRYREKTAAEWAAALQSPDFMQAYGALSEADPSALPVLAALMRHPSVPVRVGASNALAQLGPKDPEHVVPVLVDALADRALSVRCWAADGLAAVGPAAAPAVPALVSALKTHPRREPSLEGPERYYADARMSAATALGSIGPAARAAVPDLREALEDEKDAVREAARAALLRIEGR